MNKIWGTEVVTWIRGRTREEWQEFFQMVITDGRIWIQENGEKAALVGIIVGFLVAYLFKIFLFLAVLSSLAVYLIWLISLPAKEISNNDTSTDSNNDVP